MLLNKQLIILLTSILIINGIPLIVYETEGAQDSENFQNVSGPSAFFTGGDGSPGNPYQISNVTELQDINSNLSAHYILVNDIEANVTSEWNGGLGFLPIAGDINSSVGWKQGDNFTGSFDGKGYRIFNLTINRTGEEYVGLIGMMISAAKISNVSLINYNVSGLAIVGGLIGRNSGIVTHCNAYGNAIGTGDYIGGLIGWNSAVTVTNCTAYGNATGDDFIGVLIGRNSAGTVTDCTAYGNASGDYSIGGLIGDNPAGTVSNCTSYGIATGNVNIGGLIGDNPAGTVSNCTSYGIATGNVNIGGLIGWNDKGTIKDCTAYGNAIGTASGGLVGYNNYGKVTNCIAYGNSTDHGYNGGLIGFNNFGHVINCIAYGNINSDSDYTGGLIGNNYGTVTNCTAYGNATGSDYVGGLIGLSSIADVTNSTTFGNVTGTGQYIGGLIGYTEGGGEIIECVSKGNVTGWSNIGGLVGYNNAKEILNCRAYGNATGTSAGSYTIGGLIGGNIRAVVNCTAFGNAAGHSYTGGLIGVNSGPITKCTTYGNAISTGDYIGGLIGLNGWTVTDCTAYGNTNGEDFIGGLIGDNPAGTVLNCTAHGNAAGSGDKVGGLIGRNSGTTTTSYCEGTIKGDHDVGGLIGNNTGSVANCYSHSNVTGNDTVGGLIGNNFGGTVDDCYSKGFISGNTAVGGLIGKNTGTVTDCFWDNETSGQTSSAGGTGHSTRFMKSYFNYLNAEWDFKNIWGIKHRITYPYFGKVITPIAFDDIYNGNEDQKMNIASPGPLYNDFPNEIYELMVTDSDSTSKYGAAVNVAVDGSFQYDPTSATALQALAVGEYLIDSFNYTVSDSYNRSDPAVVYINVSGINDAPSALADSGSTNEDTVLNKAAPGVLSNDSDIDNSDTLSVQAGSLVTANGASVTLKADGSFTYDPTGAAALQALAVGNSIIDTFTYIVTDGNGGSDTATVSITVNGVNDAPDAISDMASLQEDSGVNHIDVLINDDDIDGDFLTITQVTQGTFGTVSIIVGGSGLSYAPDADFYGTDNFTYTISDGNGGTDTANVSVIVKNIIDPLEWVKVPSDQVIDEGDKLYLSVLAQNPDQPLSITYGISSVPTSGISIDTVTGAISWSNAVEETYTVNVSATDGITMIYHNFKITVNDVPVVQPPKNNPPIINEISNQVAMVNETFSLQVSGTDPDANDAKNLTFYLMDGPSGLVVSSSGKILWVPGAGQVGKHTVTIGLSDTKNSTSASFEITVSKKPPVEPPRNSIPVIDPISDQVVTAGEVLVLTVTGSDEDEEDVDDLVFSLTDAPSGMVISKDGTIIWVPMDSQLGDHTVTVGLTDGKNGTSRSFIVTAKEKEIVEPPKNEPPSIDSVPEGQSATVEESFELTITGTDADSDDTITFELVDAPDGMVISSDGEILWVPTDSQVGEHTVVVSASDGKNETTMSFTLTVEEAEEPEQPDEKDEKEDSGLEGAGIYIPIGLIIGIIIGIVVGMMIKSRKKPEESEEEPDEE